MKWTASNWHVDIPKSFTSLALLWHPSLMCPADRRGQHHGSLFANFRTLHYFLTCWTCITPSPHASLSWHVLLYGYFQTYFFFRIIVFDTPCTCILVIPWLFKELVSLFTLTSFLCYWNRLSFFVPFLKDVRVPWNSFTVILQPKVPSLIVYWLKMYSCNIICIALFTGN